MPGFDGTGPMGMGAMTGGARGPCNVYGRPYARGGFRPRLGRAMVQEMDFLRDQAAALKSELDAIEARLRTVESEEKASA